MDEEIEYILQEGNIAKSEGDRETARDLFRQGLEAARDAEDKRGEVHALISLGSLSPGANGEELKEAELYFTRALELSRDIGDQTLEARCLRNLGALRYEQTDFVAAEQLFTECVERSREIGDSRIEASCLKNLGSLFYDRGNLEIASEYYRESCNRYREIDDAEGEAACREFLGIVARAKDELDEAEEQFHQALELSRENSDRWGQITALDHLTETALEREGTWRSNAAQDYARQSRELKQEQIDRPDRTDERAWGQLWGRVNVSRVDSDRIVDFLFKLVLVEIVGLGVYVSLFYPEIRQSLLETGGLGTAADTMVGVLLSEPDVLAVAVALGLLMGALTFGGETKAGAGFQRVVDFLFRLVLNEAVGLSVYVGLFHPTVLRSLFEAESFDTAVDTVLAVVLTETDVFAVAIALGLFAGAMAFVGDTEIGVRDLFDRSFSPFLFPFVVTQVVLNIVLWTAVGAIAGPLLYVWSLRADLIEPVAVPVGSEPLVVLGAYLEVVTANLDVLLVAVLCGGLGLWKGYNGRTWARTMGGFLYEILLRRVFEDRYDDLVRSREQAYWDDSEDGGNGGGGEGGGGGGGNGGNGG